MLHPDAKVMKCLGHEGRAHNHQLKSFATKKQVTSGFVNRHNGTHPDIATVKCSCEGRNHKKGCGCMSDDFVHQARINH